MPPSPMTGVAPSASVLRPSRCAARCAGMLPRARPCFGRTALFLESRYINVNAKQPVGFAYAKANYIPIILGFQF